jgi:hypothetical protein
VVGVGCWVEPIEAFVVGALAKGLATVITYPLQLAQVLMRLEKTEEVLDGKTEEVLIVMMTLADRKVRHLFIEEVAVFKRIRDED